MHAGLPRNSEALLNALPSHVIVADGTTKEIPAATRLLETHELEKP
jgi:hypothetical protein